MRRHCLVHCSTALVKPGGIRVTMWTIFMAPQSSGRMINWEVVRCDGGWENMAVEVDEGMQNETKRVE